MTNKPDSPYHLRVDSQAALRCHSNEFMHLIKSRAYDLAAARYDDGNNVIIRLY